MKSFGSYFERFCCCCRKPKVAAEEEAPEDVPSPHYPEESEKLLARAPSIDWMALRAEAAKIVTEQFTSHFWPTLLHDLADYRLRFEAATCIQRHIRGYLGRKEYRRRWRAAMKDMQNYWDTIRDREKWEKEQLLLKQRARQKFASEVVHWNLANVMSSQIRNKAALIIQCWWRGYVARTITSYLSMLSKSLVLKKKRPVPTRFTSEIFRRMYGRKYVPEGGWPGRGDEIVYDMWEYKDKPPAGRKYGLKTHKIRAAPQSSSEKSLLLSDKNAWVGIPVSLTDPSTLPKKINPVTVNSPYAAPVVPPNPDLYTKHATVKEKLSQLGFANAAVSNKTRRTLRYSNLQPTTTASTMQSRGVRKPQIGVNLMDTSQLLLQPSLLQTFGKDDESSIQSSSSSLSSFRTQIRSVARPVTTSTTKSNGSAWLQLKNEAKSVSRDITMKSKAKAEQSLESAHTRDRPWPVKKKKIYKLDYTWLPQPLLHRAANELYTHDEPPEDPAVIAAREAAEAELNRRKQLFHQVSVMSTLTGLQSVIAEEKKNYKPPKLEHPYHWL